MTVNEVKRDEVLGIKKLGVKDLARVLVKVCPPTVIEEILNATAHIELNHLLNDYQVELGETLHESLAENRTW